MKHRRQNDLPQMPRDSVIAAVVGKCLEIAAAAPAGDTDAAIQAIDKAFKPEKLCDCLPGQCTKSAEYCKDWNKRGGK